MNKVGVDGSPLNSMDIQDLMFYHLTKRSNG